jgi:hypothetical protein
VTRLARYWWVAVILLAILAAIGLAFGPNGLLAGSSPASSPEPCSPAPCAAPHGFEVDVFAATAGDEMVVVKVGFKNHTPEGFGAGNYRPTSPADFQLRQADGSQVRATFGGACTDWGEIHVIRGQSAGPESLCFKAGSVTGAYLVWSPDLGILFDDVRIPLDQG